MAPTHSKPSKDTASDTSTPSARTHTPASTSAETRSSSQPKPQRPTLAIPAAFASLQRQGVDWTEDDGPPPTRTCDSCKVTLSTATTTFERVSGKGPTGNTSYRWLCPSCLQHYYNKLMGNQKKLDHIYEEEGRVPTELREKYERRWYLVIPTYSTPANQNLPALVWTQTTATNTSPSIRARGSQDFTRLEKASSAAQRAASHPEREPYVLPAARLPISGDASANSSRSMPPPAQLPQHRNVAQVIKGYTGAHREYGAQVEKMLGKISKPVAGQIGQRKVSLLFALHYEREGRSGTSLLWNIEQEVEVVQTISRAQLRTTALDTLIPLFKKRSEGFPLRTEDLVMYKATKIPLDIDLTVDPPRRAEDHCVVPFFQKANAKPKVLLVMDAQLHEQLGYYLVEPKASPEDLENGDDPSLGELKSSLFDQNPHDSLGSDTPKAATVKKSTPRQRTAAKSTPTPKRKASPVKLNNKKAKKTRKNTSPPPMSNVIDVDNVDNSNGNKDEDADKSRQEATYHPSEFNPCEFTSMASEVNHD
ncbi:hypothetical protein EIP86_001397 [Pleurotus ostreatoroseus]|nr:hypothetical protein EIP86_001397 [Pleurotus ostreatoroseus]